MRSSICRTHRPLAATAASLMALTFAVPALAQQVPPDVQAKIDAMQAQIDAQQAQLNALKSQIATQYNAPAPAAAPVAVAAAPAKPAASNSTVSIKNGTPTFSSNDGAFTLAITGVIQADAATYMQEKDLPAAVTARDLNSGTNFRRARFGFKGKLYSNFDYTMIFDFAGAGAEDVGRVHEAWLQYSGFKSAKFRVGEFAPSVGLADAGSTNASPFMERASSAEIARNIGGGDTRMGIAIFNAFDRWLYSVALTGNTISTLNTQGPFAAQNYDEQFGMAARIAGTPFKGKNSLIHIGLNYSAVINPADIGANSSQYVVQLRDRPELRVDGTRLIDTSGNIRAQSAAATGVELGGQYKNLYFGSEAFQYKIKRLPFNVGGPVDFSGWTDPNFNGWYIEGGWVLTGESRKYNTQTAAFDGITPHNNFDPRSGHWGAVELVARYSTIDLNYHDMSALKDDRVLGGQQDITSLGLNWQLNPSIRFIFQGQDVSVDRMNSSGAQIGQDYTTFAARAQFNY